MTFFEHQVVYAIAIGKNFSKNTAKLPPLIKLGANYEIVVIDGQETF